MQITEIITGGIGVASGVFAGYAVTYGLQGKAESAGFFAGFALVCLLWFCERIWRELFKIQK